MEGRTGSSHGPIWLGKYSSLSRRLWAQFISVSTYSGADSFVGRLYFTPSSHRYSNLSGPWSTYKSHPTLSGDYLGPADMIGHCDDPRGFNKTDLGHGEHQTRTDLLGGAKLGDCTVKHVQVVEEIDGYPTEMGKRTNDARLDIGNPPCTANHSFVSSPSGN